jgi:hypothetical protein
MKRFSRLPQHIGIIPDGNRRWALRKGLKKQDGYESGLQPGLEAAAIRNGTMASNADAGSASKRTAPVTAPRNEVGTNRRRVRPCPANSSR